MIKNTYDILMISGRKKVNKFSKIRLILGEKFGDDNQLNANLSESPKFIQNQE